MSVSIVLERSFKVLEVLSSVPQGLGVTDIGEQLQLPKSTVHRLLSDLVTLGYVVFVDELKTYSLSLKLPQLSFRSLALNSLYDTAQPILTEIAEASGELVRLSLVREERLIFLAKAQGRAVGLKVDADMGQEAYLGYSASGLAWLSSLKKEQAWDLLQQQLLRLRYDNLPQTFVEDKSLLYQALNLVNEQGFSMLNDTMGIGTTAIAAPIYNGLHSHKVGIGVISIAGPSIRFTLEKQQKVIPLLLEKTAELSLVSIVNQ